MREFFRSLCDRVKCIFRQIKNKFKKKETPKRNEMEEAWYQAGVALSRSLMVAAANFQAMKDGIEQGLKEQHHD